MVHQNVQEDWADRAEWALQSQLQSSLMQTNGWRMEIPVSVDWGVCQVHSESEILLLHSDQKALDLTWASVTTS
jgi:hypothetical protein